MAIARSFSAVNEWGCVRIEDPNAFALRTPPASFDRVEQLLNFIAEAMIKRGHEARSGEQGLVFIVDSEAIAFCIVHPMRRRPHVSTPEERANEQKRQAELGWRVVMLLGGSGIPQWDYEPGPEMVVEIGGDRRLGPAHRIRDTRQRRLEERIDDIANVFEAHAGSLKTRREQQKVASEDARLAAIDRVAAAERAKLEMKRKAYLDQKLLQHDESVRIERMLATIAGLGGASDVTVARFVEWTTAHLAIARAAFAAEAIRREISELFSDDGEE
ncbi:hypothetical protein [Sphingomonas sp. PB4P5]|uniref:hypothetical protein n=1 Tax=Parasphingomonas puruogangriensis TaxID=3096155 RepID=UPI002FCA280E